MRRSRWEDIWADFETWMGLQGFAVEVPFRGMSGKRRWRFDFGLSDGRKVAVEYHGKGAHTHSIAGTYRDHEKMTEAALCGWLVIQCNARTVEDGSCIGWVEAALADERGGG